ncbi:hypothetical protein VP758_002441 [Vibrio harveyi]|nr:hypothetical protein [Vibrio harveyi]
MFFLSPRPISTGDRRPATSNQQPATSNQQPATSNQQPATSLGLLLTDNKPMKTLYSSVIIN